MGYVSEFSPDGKLFASLDSNGKLKIWNTETNELAREYTPNLHLSASCKTIQWIEVRNEQNEPTLCIALGTSKGGIDLYSYAANKIVKNFKGDGHAGAITSICLHGKKVFTSGEDCCIVEWSLKKGCDIKKWSIGKVIPTYIVSLPENNCLLVACKELNLWSLENNKLKYTFTGHEKDVLLMRVMKLTRRDKEEEFALTVSKTSREILLWTMNVEKTNDRKKESGKNKDRKNALATFLMNYWPVFIDCLVKGDGFTIAAVTGVDPAAGGVIHLFTVKDISDLFANDNVIKPDVTIQILYDVSPTPTIAATLNFSAKGSKNILIGYGNSPIFRFENITYDHKEKVMVLLREDPQAQSKSTTKNQSRTIVPNIHDDGTEYNTGMTAERKRKGKEFAMDEILAKLSLTCAEKGTGKSIKELLRQALKNQDPNLLRHVFFIKDESVIRSSVQQLTHKEILDLVHELTLLAQKKTANVQTAVCWLRILVQTHLSQFIALGTAELTDTFGTLLGILEHKTHTLNPLSMLTGRLDLLLHQIKYNTDDSIPNNENVLIYEDKDESEEHWEMQSEEEEEEEEEKAVGSDNDMEYE